MVAKASGLSRKTIEKGVRELKEAAASLVPEGRSWRSGGGRKKEKEKHPELADALQHILDGNTYGDPTRVLFHTSISTYKAAAILSSEYGIYVSEDTVSRLMEELGHATIKETADTYTHVLDDLKQNEILKLDNAVNYCF